MTLHQEPIPLKDLHMIAIQTTVRARTTCFPATTVTSFGNTKQMLQRDRLLLFVPGLKTSIKLVHKRQMRNDGMHMRWHDMLS